MYLVPKPPFPPPRTPASDRERLLAQIPYRRIADQIDLLWASAECDHYLNTLLINDREAHRQGFPPEVSRAIFGLITLNELARRRDGSAAPLDTISGLDWANETGKWKIVKSRELQKTPGQDEKFVGSGRGFSV